MKLDLAENIRALRKQRGMTQEQLSDVMGVTTGAVYKWEAGLSVPELELIVKMTYFFDVSVDALLGCKSLDNRLDATVRRLKEYCVKADPRGDIEAESAFGKYPNSFEVVYHSAELYFILGKEGHDKAKLSRALELFELAFSMLPQNTDAVNLIDKFISELLAILACAYIKLGNKEQARTVLQKAAKTARSFDAFPEYCMDNIRFTGKAENMRINDVLGTTAAESIENILGLLGDKETASMWHRMTDTEEGQ